MFEFKLKKSSSNCNGLATVNCNNLNKIDGERERHKFVLLKNNSFIVFCLLTILSFLYVKNIYSFLAITNPSGNGEILVVEGWIPTYLLEQAVPLINQGYYKTIAVVGGPSSNGTNSEQIEQTAAYLGKRELLKFGVPNEKIVTIPVWHLKRNRTFTSAKAVNAWLKDTNPSVQAVDIFTAAVHGRKSQLLYQRALGKSMSVGVYSARAAEFSGKSWFESKRGIYLVLRNTVGYVKALFFTF